jgi:hypothetical protein
MMGNRKRAKGSDEPELTAQRPGGVGGDQDAEYVQLTAYIAEYGVDLDNQRVDPEWLKRELDRWMAGGGYVTIDFRGDPEAQCSKITYDERGAEGTVVALTEKARKAITSGIYAGLGIGIQNAKVDITDEVAHSGRITDGRVTQVSLLDRPMSYRDPRLSPVIEHLEERHG